MDGVVFERNNIAMRPCCGGIGSFNVRFRVLSNGMRCLKLSLFSAIGGTCANGLLYSRRRGIRVVGGCVDRSSLLSTERGVVSVIRPTLGRGCDKPFKMSVVVTTGSNRLRLMSYIRLGLQEAVKRITLRLTGVAGPRDLVHISFSNGECRLHILPNGRTIGRSWVLTFQYGRSRRLTFRERVVGGVGEL